MISGGFTAAYRRRCGNRRAKPTAFGRKGDYWSVRINRGHRALGREHAGTLYWFWIGPHDEYERLINP